MQTSTVRRKSVAYGRPAQYDSRSVAQGVQQPALACPNCRPRTILFEDCSDIVEALADALLETGSKASQRCVDTEQRLLQRGTCTSECMSQRIMQHSDPKCSTVHPLPWRRVDGLHGAVLAWRRRDFWDGRHMRAIYTALRRTTTLATLVHHAAGSGGGELTRPSKHTIRRITFSWCILDNRQTTHAHGPPERPPGPAPAPAQSQAMSIT